MFEYLKDVFSLVPTLILSATIIPNIFDYIRIFLKLLSPFQIYRLPLDRPNLKYMVSPIQKSGFQDVAFLVPKLDLINKILKTMIFVNKIKDVIEMERYLQFRLPDYISYGN